MRNLFSIFLYFLISLCFFSTFAIAAPPSNPTGFGRKVVSESLPLDPISSGTTTSINQYGVTWKFSKSVTYGQFVTGDYWIVDSGGGVTVNSVSPAPSNGKNGSMINPLPGKGQGFDSGGEDYESAMSISFPVKVVAGDALLSSISLNGSETSNWEGKSIGSNSRLRTVAVLTILSKVPPSGTFRPSYVDRSQKLYNVSQINTNVLPNVSATSLPAHSGFSTLGFFERGMERPWILFGNDWQSRTLHPTEQMNDYHEQVGFFLSEASLLLTTSVADKTTLLHRYIQVGIDYYHCGPTDSSAWTWPVIFTGLLLDDPNIYNYWINHPSKRTQREHEKLYYIGDVSTAKTSSIIPKGKTWVDWVTKEGKSVAFRKQIGEEYDHLHPSEWTCYAPHCKAEVYRTQFDVYPLVGMVLSSIIVDKHLAKDVNAMIAHNPVRDYIYRWMGEGFMSKQYKSTGRTYLQEMEYYTNFTIYYYRYGTGGSDFVNKMWATYQ